MLVSTEISGTTPSIRPHADDFRLLDLGIGPIGRPSSGRSGVFFCDQTGNVYRMSNGESKYSFIFNAGPQFDKADVYQHDLCLVLHNDNLLLVLPDYTRHVNKTMSSWEVKPAEFGPDADYELRTDVCGVRRLSESEFLVTVLSGAGLGSPTSASSAEPLGAEPHGWTAPPATATLFYELFHQRVCIRTLQYFRSTEKEKVQWLQVKGRKPPLSIAASRRWPPASHLASLIFCGWFLVGRWRVVVYQESREKQPQIHFLQDDAWSCPAIGSPAKDRTTSDEQSISAAASNEVQDSDVQEGGGGRRDDNERRRLEAIVQRSLSDCLSLYRSSAGLVFVRRDGSIAVLGSVKGEPIVTEICAPHPVERRVEIIGEYVLVYTLPDIEVWSLRDTTATSLFRYAEKDIKDVAFTLKGKSAILYILF